MKNDIVKATDKRELYSFLKEIDSSFPVPLSKKQDLKEYAYKLEESATVLVRREEDKIVALVAGYTENLTENMAYISVLATLDKARGKGYANGLVEEFLKVCASKNISAVHLYAVASNTPAVNLYKKLGFVEYKMENEPRKDDLHLIYYLNEQTKG